MSWPQQAARRKLNDRNRFSRADQERAAEEKARFEMRQDLILTGRIAYGAP
jgi:hypothetical protein